MTNLFSALGGGQSSHFVTLGKIRKGVGVWRCLDGFPTSTGFELSWPPLGKVSKKKKKKKKGMD